MVSSLSQCLEHFTKVGQLPTPGHLHNGSIWRNLKLCLCSWNCKENLKSRSLNGAFWRYLTQCFYFSILWFIYAKPLHPHFYSLFRIKKCFYSGFQFKSLLERVNEYATLRACARTILHVLHFLTSLTFPAITIAFPAISISHFPPYPYRISRHICIAFPVIYISHYPPNRCLADWGWLLWRFLVLMIQVILFWTTSLVGEVLMVINWALNLACLDILRLSDVIYPVSMH